MQVILWACPLVVRRSMSVPKVVEVLDTLGPHTTSWSTTVAYRSEPYAVGCSDVSVEQAAALQAESLILCWTDIDWQRQFSDLPAAMRNRINAFCTKVGIARPMTNEVLRDLLSRMTMLIDQKLIEDHVHQVTKQGTTPPA